MNVRDMNTVLSEYNVLSRKPRHTPADTQRMAYLQTAVSAIKAGASLAEINAERANDAFKRIGLPTFELGNPEDEIKFRGWRSFVNSEKRDMVGGDPKLRTGTYSDLGYFVPTGFYDGLFRQMAAHDPLFDEDSATVLKTPTGNAMTIPTAADIENVATLTSEGGSRASVDYSSTGHIKLGAYSFSSPRFVSSLETWQDLQGTFDLLTLAETFFADRIARGVGNYLINGTGNGSQPTGLLVALAQNGAPVIHATGSSASTGGTETGANSLGIGDFGAALAALDSAYASQPKVAWLMNRKTLGYLNSLVTKMGTPLGLVDYCDGGPCILGIPVKISPSMPNIGASATPVVLGDFAYYVTRLVNSENLGLTVIKEADGLIEKGNFGIVAFFRADGNVAVNDPDSPSPFVVIQNHS